MLKIIRNKGTLPLQERIIKINDHQHYPTQNPAAAPDNDATQVFSQTPSFVQVDGFSMEPDTPQDQAYGPYQGCDPNQAFAQNQAAVPNQAYVPNQPFAQNQAAPNQAYAPNQVFEPNQSYAPNPAPDQNQVYNQNQAYPQAPGVMPYESYFDGGLLQVIGWGILGALVIILTLGICAPWAFCMIYRWGKPSTP